MALSDTQTLNLFHCLEVPYSASYAGMDGMGAAYIQTANQPILSAAKSAILAFVATMEAIAIVDLGLLLDEYNDVRSVDFEQVGGSLGVFSGLNISASRYRDNLKHRVQELVPFLRYHEILQRQSGSASQSGGVCVR